MEDRNICLSKDKIKHSVAVAEYMQYLAKQGFYKVDPSIAYFTGLNHDIGYVKGRIDHEDNGCALLEKMGVTDTDILMAIKYHGKNPELALDRMEKEYEIGKIPELLEMLWIADLSVDKYGNKCGFEKRLEDIGNRYGFDSFAYVNAKVTSFYAKRSLMYHTTMQQEDFERINKGDYAGVDKALSCSTLPYTMLEKMYNYALINLSITTDDKGLYGIMLKLTTPTLSYLMDNGRINIEQMAKDHNWTLSYEDIQELKDIFKNTLDKPYFRKLTTLEFQNMERAERFNIERD